MTAPAPDTATVRGRYCDGLYLQTGHTTDGQDFDRWLAEHDREVATGRESRQADERVATALERIATALERVPAVTVGEFDLAGCDDRTCANRDRWTPTGRINHGSTPTTCTHGQDHSDDLECEYHDKPLPDGEFHVSSLETGKPVRVTVTNRQTGSTLFDGDTLTFCDCPPDDDPVATEAGPRTDDGAKQAHVDPLTPDEALEGR